PSDPETKRRLEASQIEMASVQDKILYQSNVVRDAREAFHQAEVAYNEDRRIYQEFQDARAAGAIFRSLEPSCCPRCDVKVTDERKQQELKTHACSVCGEHVGEEDSTLRDSDLKAAKTASTDAYKVEKEALQKEIKRYTLLDDRSKYLSNQLEALSKQFAEHGAWEKWDREVAILEARLKELSSEWPQPEEDEGSDLDEKSEKVLKAAHKVVDGKIKEKREDTLTEVSEMITYYAQEFGIEHLTQATLKGNPSLEVIVGGVKNTFSKVTDGEKLRYKIATLLAMIHVAEKSGVGRHPGLVMIDSPAAQEMAPEDLEALMSGLAKEVNEFDHLQLFVMAREDPILLKHIPEDHLRQARGNDYLW
ncbi:MAG: hypothetical protein HQM14_20145, partial [SAR324 cluster bacterium]|nr:hypothetical protein [SAR324 cluster bacterium]